MLINSFFSFKFYVLGGCWVKSDMKSSQLNNSVYIGLKNLDLYYLAYNYVTLKKILLLMQNLVLSSGSLAIVSSYFYLFKNIQNSSFFIKELFLNEYSQGIISNYSPSPILNLIPDLALVFNAKPRNFITQEFRSLGIPIAGIATYSHSLYLLDYKIFLDVNSYFINFIVFRIYSCYLQHLKSN